MHSIELSESARRARFEEKDCYQTSLQTDDFPVTISLSLRQLTTSKTTDSKIFDRNEIEEDSSSEGESPVSSVGDEIDVGIREIADLRGEQHPDMLFSLLTVANACTRNGDDEEAIRYYKEALSLNRKLNGTNHPKVGDNLVSMATAMDNITMYNEEITVLEEALDIYRLHGTFNMDTDEKDKKNKHGRKIAHILNKIGNCYFHLRLVDKAIEKYEEAFEAIKHDSVQKNSVKPSRLVSNISSLSSSSLSSMTLLSSKCRKQMERSKSMINYFKK